MMKERAIEILSNKLDALIEDVNKIHTELLEYKKTFLYYNSITEDELIFNINNGIFDETLVGKSVELAEDFHTHEWVIIRVNSDSYDLWYKGTIGKAMWKGSYDNRLWINNNPTDTDYVRGLCNAYKSKLSSNIQAKLKTGLNADCGDDLVVILAEPQLGGTGYAIANTNDNSPIPYFNSNDKRSIGSMYWTTSVDSFHTNSIWFVMGDGTFNYIHYVNHSDVVPAIRVGI